MSDEQILVVDDEKNILRSLRGILEDENYRVREASTAAAAIDALATREPDLILLDVWLPDRDGLDLLEQLKQERPDLPVVIMSGHGNIEMAVRATKLGAYDFIEKPLGMEKVILAVRNALVQSRLERENRGLREMFAAQYAIVGESQAIQELVRQIDIAAPTNGRILISGENGTGKELVARTIHFKSRRMNGPFVAVNCAAIPEELMESEFFGHERGSFTGAVSQKKGKFELASGGTLFLDEIGDMSPKTQAKVLRVLEEQTFSRVGGSKEISIDVRVIAASNKNLAEEISAGRFREDLFYRLNVIPLFIPPLRERAADIPLLVRHFVDYFSSEHGRRVTGIAPDAMASFTGYFWPGNVRELKNIIERVVIMSRDGELSLEAVPAPIRGTPTGAEPAPGGELPLREARLQFEKGYIARILSSHGHNITQAAKILQVERSNLHRRIKQLDIK